LNTEVTRVSLLELPASAAWLHREARSGFEVVYFEPVADGRVVTGCTAALEDGQTWFVSYVIHLDPTWKTRSARVTGRSTMGSFKLQLDTDGHGHWLVEGRAAPKLDGCLDVDLESSAMTNALPVHRLALAVGGRASAPAAYVRAADLAVERLEQEYVRIGDDGPRQRYDYAAPSFDFECRLVYDSAGLLLDYPGIAARAG
jgi:hypothetical protein